jgi:hypothetical protein
VAMPAEPAPVGVAASRDTAVFAGGCFWGVEAVFEHLKGVSTAISGYAGGTVRSPSYELVSSGTTGHAESVLVVCTTLPGSRTTSCCRSSSAWPTTRPSSTARARMRVPVSLGRVLPECRAARLGQAVHRQAPVGGSLPEPDRGVAQAVSCALSVAWCEVEGPRTGGMSGLAANFRREGVEPTATR